jgi:hypothetical protein
VEYHTVRYPIIADPIKGYPITECLKIGVPNNGDSYIGVPFSWVTLPAMGYHTVRYPIIGYPKMGYLNTGYTIIMYSVMRYPAMG